MYIIHNNLVHNLRNYLRYIKWLLFIQSVETNDSNSSMSVQYTEIILNLIYKHYDIESDEFEFSDSIQRDRLMIIKTLSKLGLVRISKKKVFDDTDDDFLGFKYKIKATHIGNKYLKTVNIQHNIKPPKPVTFSDLSIHNKMIACLGVFFIILEIICAATVITFLLLVSFSNLTPTEHLFALPAMLGSFLLAIPSVICMVGSYARTNNERGMDYVNKIRKFSKSNHSMYESRFLKFLLKNHIIEMRLDYLDHYVIRVINNLMFG